MDTEKNISEIMTTEIISVHCRDSVAKVQQIFEGNNIHHIVVKNENGFCGIISNNDVLQLLLKAYREKKNISLMNKKAEDIMTANPLTIDIEDSIGFAADIFLANHIHALPVLDDEKLVGIVTDYDLLKFGFS